jgi:hypothetical protein
MKRFDGDESGVFVLDPREARVGGDAGRDDVNRDQTEARAWLKKLRELPPVRLAKVLKVREEIAKGTYESEEKWRIAIDRLLEELR